MPTRLIALAACATASTLAPVALAASADGNVEWNGVSHIGFQDRNPLCPVGGESFTVRFQSFRDDLTAARVRIDDGAITFVNAGVVQSRGPYDIWEATVPATVATSESYVLELTDGVDVDYLGSSGMQDGLPANEFELDFTTLEHAPVGATLVTGGVVFKVWSPSTTSCHVRGEFNGWTTQNPLTRAGQHWISFVAGASAGQMYKFFFDNLTWNSDPRGRRLNPIDNLNSFIIDPLAHNWQIEDFSPAPIEDMVIYQLHIGTFAGRNDPMGPTSNPSGYLDVAARAGHLAELGVNTVMLNPMMEFPGDFSGGYNPITQYGPEWRYGTPDDFKTMVDALHAQGIAVLLDIVWNHFSPTDNFLWMFDGTQLYFDTPNEDTPWGAQADFNAGGVRDYYLESVVLWLDEYRLDGFRMDATSFMDTQGGAGWSLMQAMNNLIDARYADKVAIAEQLPDNDFITRPVSIGGAGFDAQYYDFFTDELRQETFDAAFGNPEMFKLANIINGGGQFLSGSKVLNYFELHDEAWTSSGGQRAVKTIDNTAPHDDQFAMGRTKLAQGFVHMAPGIPAFLMGTEWLEDAGFESQKIDWSKKTTYSEIFAYYQALIGLRAENTALRANSPHDVFHVNDRDNVIAWQRFNLDGLVYLIVANFSNNDFATYRVGVPFAGSWTEVLNSQDASFGGSGLVNPTSVNSESVPQDSFADSMEIASAAMSISVFQLDIDIFCLGDADGSGAVDFGDITSVLGNWLADYTPNSGPGDANGDGVVNFGDITTVLGNWLVPCP